MITGVFGFSIKKSKKAKFICITKNGKCEFTNEDYNYILKLLGEEYSNISEGVYCLPLEFDEKIFNKNGFIENENRAKIVIDYMKENGKLKSYK